MADPALSCGVDDKGDHREDVRHHQDEFGMKLGARCLQEVGDSQRRAEEKRRQGGADKAALAQGCGDQADLTPSRRHILHEDTETQTDVGSGQSAQDAAHEDRADLQLSHGKAE